MDLMNERMQGGGKRRRSKSTKKRMHSKKGKTHRVKKHSGRRRHGGSSEMLVPLALLGLNQYAKHKYGRPGSKRSKSTRKRRSRKN